MDINETPFVQLLDYSMLYICTLCYMVDNDNRYRQMYHHLYQIRLD